MGLRHDLTARLAQLSRPRYGAPLRFAGTDLPAPTAVTFETVAGPVRALRYPGRRNTTYLHFHGGAFMMRRPEMDDFWARFVVAETGLGVVLADYEVAPQVRYPVAHEQAWALTVALARESPVLVGGFSAGGNLAASVALQAATGETRIALRAQLLGVPSLDVAEDTRTKAARAPASMISAGTLDLVRATYFSDAARRAEPWASPLLAPDVAGVPPAFVVTAGRDVLCEEGDRFARRLREAGVPTEHVTVPDADHYFLHGDGGRAQARALMDRMATWLSAHA